MITIEEYFGTFREKYPAEFRPEIEANARILLPRVNALLVEVKFRYRGNASGWRPPSYNRTIPNAALHSKHITGEADDVRDVGGLLGQYLLTQGERGGLLEKHDLYIEHPHYTTGRYANKSSAWVHFQSVAPSSGRRIFIPR